MKKYMDMNNIPQAYFFMGTNGSGKSSIRDKVVIPKHFIIIDPDLIAKTKNINEIQAGKEAIKLYKDCISNNKSFAMETTLSGHSSVQRIKRAKENQFETFGYYCGGPLS